MAIVTLLLPHGYAISVDDLNILSKTEVLLISTAVNITMREIA